MPLSSDSENMTSTSSRGMEVVDTIGGTSHRGDAHANSNILVQGDRLAHDTVVSTMSLECRVGSIGRGAVRRKWCRWHRSLRCPWCHRDTTQGKSQREFPPPRWEWRRRRPRCLLRSPGRSLPLGSAPHGTSGYFALLVLGFGIRFISFSLIFLGHHICAA